MEKECASSGSQESEVSFFAIDDRGRRAKKTDGGRKREKK